MSDNVARLEDKQASILKEMSRIARQIHLLTQQREHLQQEHEQVKHELASAKLSSSYNSDGTTDYSIMNCFPWSAELQRVQTQIFDVKEFRPLQLLAINAFLDGRDIILVMPTGAGKSLVYQLPAFMDLRSSRGEDFTLVVSPLVSLMADQAFSLRRRPIPPDSVAVFDASTPASHQTAFLRSIGGDPAVKAKGGAKVGTIRLVYVTPEKLAKSKRLLHRLEQAHAGGRLARIAIDEVHCVSQWGHDFRPDYKFLHVLRRQFAGVPILGLTATASAEVIVDVQGMLSLKPESCLVLRGGYNRPNLFYQVHFHSGPVTASYADIISLLKTDFCEQSGIIYCLSQNDTEDLASTLVREDISASFYHANMDANQRNVVHSKWLDNSLKVIVATVAFGMGIDKPDVRFVIHLSASKSLENYYQESGRAGRDGQPSRVVLFWRFGDLFRLASLVFAEKTGLSKLMLMVSYVLEHQQCRRKLLADSLGDNSWNSTDCNQNCDICASTPSSAADQKTMDATALMGVIEGILGEQSQGSNSQRLTGLKLVKIMERSDSIRRIISKLTPPLHAHHLHLLCQYIVSWLILKRCLKLDFHFTPYSTIAYISPLNHNAPAMPVPDRLLKSWNKPPRREQRANRKNPP